MTKLRQQNEEDASGGKTTESTGLTGPKVEVNWNAEKRAGSNYVVKMAKANECGSE